MESVRVAKIRAANSIKVHLATSEGEDIPPAAQPGAHSHQADTPRLPQASMPRQSIVRYIPAVFFVMALGNPSAAN